jgi:hypothetical protein
LLLPGFPEEGSRLIELVRIDFTPFLLQLHNLHQRAYFLNKVPGQHFFLGQSVVIRALLFQTADAFIEVIQVIGHFTHGF